MSNLTNLGTWSNNDAVKKLKNLTLSFWAMLPDMSVFLVLLKKL